MQALIVIVVEPSHVVSRAESGLRIYLRGNRIRRSNVESLHMNHVCSGARCLSTVACEAFIYTDDSHERTTAFEDANRSLRND
jgi:hypothetical protein